MKMELEQILPGEIERRSFEIITEELGGKIFPEGQEDIIKRVIHTTADFEYADTMTFSPDAVSSALGALTDRGNTVIVTDTNMTRSGIHKASLEKLGIEAVCYMADPDVAEEAKREGTTRAAASMKKAADMAQKTGKQIIISVGNAPTALICASGSCDRSSGRICQRGAGKRTDHDRGRAVYCGKREKRRQHGCGGHPQCLII